MNKKLVLSVLSTAVVASMASAAMAKPQPGFYVGGEVDKYYSIDAFLGDHFDDALNDIISELGDTVFVDDKANAAPFVEALDANTAEELAAIMKPATVATFNGNVYANVGDPTAEPYNPATDKDLEPGTPVGDLVVESVSAINNELVQVVYSKEVDEASAVTMSNYKIDGVALGNADGYATLEADGKTVSIFLATPQPQDSKVTLSASGILGADNVLMKEEVSKEISFRDTANPTLVKAELRSGNKVLRLTYSEPVRGNVAALGTYKLDGKSLTTFGGNAVAYKQVSTGNGQQDDLRTVDITFATAIPAGAHSITVLNQAGAQVVDNQGFAVINGKADFTATGDTTPPTVLETKATSGNPGTIEIKFNERLGTVVAGYTVNGAPAAAVLKPNTVDTVLVTANVAAGVNLVTVPKAQADAFGNAVGTEDLRLTVNASADTVAPTVKNVVAVTDQKVRVVFSESVANAFATTKANYTIKDASGAVVHSATVNANGYNLTSSVNGDGAVVDIDFTAPLSGSNFTLEIKNLRDGAGNIMAPFTGSFTSPDKTPPTLATSGNKAVLTGQTVEIFFSEQMDAASLANKVNFMYSTGGNFVALPTSAVIEPATNGKSVKITFPAAINAGSITDLKVLGVKDAAGNLIANGSEQTGAPAATLGKNPLVKAGTAKVFADSTKAWVTFETDQQLESIDKADFGDGFLSGVIGEAADIATISGNTVTLTYNTDAAEVASIAAAGDSIEIAAGQTLANSSNGYGDALKTPASAVSVEDHIAPYLVDDPLANPTANTVTLTFNENIDNGALAALKDDFIVESNGQVLTVTGASVANNVLTLTTKEAITVDVKVKANTSVDVEDVSGNKYVPTNADKTGYSLTVAPPAPVNDAPTVVAGEDTQTGTATPESSSDPAATPAVAYTADVTAWFEDANAGDTLTYSVVSAEDDAATPNDVSADVSIDATGTLTYTPAAAQASSTVTIVVKANDGTDDSTSNVTITVTVAAQPS